MRAETDVLVVGGGATGCGVARDLAMRGLDVTLVERGSLNAGTTGRSHGVLHSGARYADVDPESAVACREENRTLRAIAGAAVAETGGLLLGLDGDDPAYLERKRDACHDCGIETRALPADAVREREPTVTDAVVRALAVPDAVVYPSRLVAATAASAREHGAELHAGATVTGIDLGDPCTVELRGADAPRSVTATHVVNAAGAWAGAVAGLAGLDVGMAPTRGLMVRFEHDGLRSVLNRCRPPADGDIVVPHAGAAVGGTTSVQVEDPDDPGGSTAEVEAVRSECAAMVPALADAPVARTFWGVRPLHDPGGRDASRGFQVIEHAARDDAPCLTTVVGGKLTTYRRMAEAVADVVCDRLGVEAACRTAEVPLPGHDDADRLDALVARFDAAGPADADVVGGPR